MPAVTGFEKKRLFLGVCAHPSFNVGPRPAVTQSKNLLRLDLKLLVRTRHQRRPKPASSGFENLLVRTRPLVVSCRQRSAFSGLEICCLRVHLGFEILRVSCTSAPTSAFSQLPCLLVPGKKKKLLSQKKQKNRKRKRCKKGPPQAKKGPPQAKKGRPQAKMLTGTGTVVE